MPKYNQFNSILCRISCLTCPRYTLVSHTVIFASTKCDSLISYGNWLYIHSSVETDRAEISMSRLSIWEFLTARNIPHECTLYSQFPWEVREIILDGCKYDMIKKTLIGIILYSRLFALCLHVQCSVLNLYKLTT